MAQQADSEAISLVIEKLTEIVERQNLPKRHAGTASSETDAPQVVASTSTAKYLEHGSEFLITEDSIAVVEEVVEVVGSSPQHSSVTSSPEKSDHSGEYEDERFVRVASLQGRNKPTETEQVILNFPVKVGNLNITNTEGLIATLQKLDSALRPGELGSGERVVKSQGQLRELFKCAKCDYCSHNKHYLKQHVELTHNADRPFKCPFCNYAGKRSHSLKEHLIVHSNCRPYSCMYCNATFRKKGHLTNHVKMHISHDDVTDENTEQEEVDAGNQHVTYYRCKFCSFVTASMEILKAHLLRHTATSKILKMVCKCGLEFTDPKILDEHINTKHAAELPAEPAPTKDVILVCSECGYKTQDKALLTEHMIKHIDSPMKPKTTDEHQHQTETEPEHQRQVAAPADAQDTSYRCAQCSFTTKTAVTFIEHMLSHKPQKQVATEATPSTSQRHPPKGASYPPQPKKAPQSEAPQQPFTHDKAGGVYRCIICGYTCEMQRTIKSHIWKHSGHHDIDYPMFRNGPISVYDDYPIGVPVLLSEKSPVTRMSSGMASPKPYPALGSHDSSTKVNAKDVIMTSKPALKEGTPARNRHKTISQILADSKSFTTSASQDQKSDQKPETCPTGVRVVATKPTISPSGGAPASSASSLPRPTMPVLKPHVQLPVQPLPSGSAPPNIVAGPYPSKTSTSTEPIKSTASPVVSSVALGQSVNSQKTATTPDELSPADPGSSTVTLPGSEILKLILKNRLRAVPSQQESTIEHDPEEASSTRKTSSMTAEAGSSAGEASTSTGVGSPGSISGKSPEATTRKRKNVESLDELELYRLAKKLCSQAQQASGENVVVEKVLQAYTVPKLSVLDSRLESPRSRSPRGQTYSPRATSPHVSGEDPPVRILRGRSRSAEEVRNLPAHEEEMKEHVHEQPTVTLLSLLKKGPNHNPAFPVMPKPEIAGSKDDGDKPKQGICSSLLAVIEQLRERSRSESEPDDGSASDKLGSKVRKRSKRGSMEEEEDRDFLLQNYANIEQIGEQYRCKLCHYTNSNSAQLKIHMRQQHKAKKPFECSLCEFLATSNEELQDHMLKHCKVRTYQCKLCQESFTYKSQLRAHMHIHADQNPYLCDHCDFQGTFTELKQHMLTHDRVYYMCSVCEQTFESMEDHQQHEAECKEKAGLNPGAEGAGQREGKKRMLQCGLCEFATSSESALVNHAVVHKGIDFQCEHCSFTATSVRSLKSHMKRHVNDQKFVQQPLEQYKCNLCGYVCHHLPSLKSHMWRHASDTNYSYQDSNDIINKAIDLDSSAKPVEEEPVEENTGGYNNFIRFRCCQCGFESVDRSELNDHMKSHSDIIQKTLEMNRGRIMNSEEDSSTEDEDEEQDMKGVEVVTQVN